MIGGNVLKTNLAVKEELMDFGHEETISKEVENQDINEKIFEINTNISKNKKILYRIIKRIIDIIGGIIGTVVLIPTTLVIYIVRIILKENDGPLFYEQLRYGKNGKQFRLYKFRSMCMNADKKLAEYLEKDEEVRKEFEENHKLKNDPRITKLGSVLRKTSLDELPQILNILKGDMSFIGPRPIIDGEIDKYGKNREKFLSVKPGLTGYWQVNRKK